MGQRQDGRHMDQREKNGCNDSPECRVQARNLITTSPCIRQTNPYYSARVMDAPVFDGLNQKQLEAARFGSGPLLIIAGAGTGKTNTLAHRVAHLVLQGAKPDRILLLTFTRRAAVEMTRRTQRIVGDVVQEVRLPWSGTFRSIANRLIRRHSASVGLDESFSVLDRGDAADLMDVLRHELGCSKADKRFPRKDTR